MVLIRIRSRKGCELFHCCFSIYLRDQVLSCCFFISLAKPFPAHVFLCQLLCWVIGRDKRLMMTVWWQGWIGVPQGNMGTRGEASREDWPLRSTQQQIFLCHGLLWQSGELVTLAIYEPLHRRIHLDLYNKICGNLRESRIITYNCQNIFKNTLVLLY